MPLKKVSISAVVSVRNEADKLARTLRSVSFADEIIVVDNQSSDETVQIAQSFTDRIFHRKNDIMLNKNKNFGISKAVSDWILYLDGDEVIPDGCGVELLRAVSEAGDVNGFWMNRKNIIFGKWIRHGLWWPDRQLRLFRKGKGKYPERHVHEYIEVAGKTGILDTAFDHYNYESIDQYVRKMTDIYIPNEVDALRSSGYVATWKDAIRFPVSDFLKVFFAQKGYKDGIHGIVLATLQSFYSFLVYAKLWEAKGFTQYDPDADEIAEEFRDRRREISYWIHTMMSDTSGTLKSFWYRFLRKINI